MKAFFYTIVLCFINITLFSQNSFYLRINFDNSVNIKQLHISYFNGENNIQVNYKLENNFINIRGVFKSQYAPLTISIYDKKQDYERVYFLRSGKSTINIIGNNLSKYFYTSKNVAQVNDTAANKVYKEIYEARIKTSKPINDLFQKYSPNEIFSIDSLTNQFKKYYKVLNDSTMLCLNKYKFDYLALWYFRTQILEPSLKYFKNDTSYLKYLTEKYTFIFSNCTLNTFEYLNLLTLLNSRINSNKVNKAAPLFSSFCTNGKFISLKNLKGKYILLDFWASWCAPCLQSIPIMKEIYKNHRKEKLVIIGVNIDSDFNLLKNAELKYQIDWLDIFDKNSKIANLYTVDKIPTFFLIDQSGAIIFRGEGLGDKEILRSILNEKLN